MIEKHCALRIVGDFVPHIVIVIVIVIVIACSDVMLLGDSDADFYGPSRDQFKIQHGGALDIGNTLPLSLTDHH